MSTSIVTGGAGFLGSHLCERLLAKGHRVICLDNLETGSLLNISHIRDENFVFSNVDITERVEIVEPVDFVYHLASPASPIDYARLPLHTLKVGSYGTHHMLGVAKFKRARFLLASTSEVYGDPQIHPQPESYWGHVNPIGPRGVYDEAKRYAEALTMAYHRQQGVDTTISRIFNSILADEQVLYDDGRELRRETAGELSARLANRAIICGFDRLPAPVGGGREATTIDPALEFPLDGFTLPSFTEGGEVLAASPTTFIGHPTEQRCYEVRTQYGRSIRVTGDHSVFVEGEAGEPEPRPVSELTTDDRIAIARRISVPERDRKTVSVIEAWRWAEEDIWDLYAEDAGLGAAVWEHRHEVLALLGSRREAAGANGTRGSRDWPDVIRMRNSDRVPLPVLWWIRMSVPSTARIRAKRGQSSLPVDIEITDRLLWLLGVWLAEGSWAENPNEGIAYISLSSDGHVIERAAAIVEEELGIHAVKQPYRDGRAPSAHFHSKLLLKLMRFLGFSRELRGIPGWILGLPLDRLKWFIEGYREGDGVHSGKKLADGKRHEFSTVNDRLKDDLIVAFARFGLCPSLGRYETGIRHKTGDRPYPFWRLTLCNVAPWSPLAWDGGVEQRLNARTHGDLVWAGVREIEEVPATPLVFDFSVPEHENFWAGTGVMAHNTFGPRMRPHDGRAVPTFLRQGLQSKPLTVFGDGAQTRSFCYVDDLISGLIALMESDYHLPVNIGNPDEFTLLQLAETVIEVTGSESEIVFEALPADDPKVRRPDISLARELLGWEPEVSLREGLQRTIDQSGHDRLIGETD
jgi:nucleoside-diphosphate-sugar epimerase/intein/homing endonuclease